MKRRKRRPDVLLISGLLAAIAFLSSYSLADSQQQSTNSKLYPIRPAAHLLGTAGSNQEQYEQHLQQLLSSYQNAINANHPAPNEDAKKISQVIKKNSLLAPAETTRLLTIGNGPQTRPPYATQQQYTVSGTSLSETNQNSSFNYTQQSRESSPPNISSGRYNVAQAHPVFLRHPPLTSSTQTFRLAYPNGLTVQLSPGLKLSSKVNQSNSNQSSGVLAIAPTNINYLQTLQQSGSSSFSPNVPITATYLRFPYGKPDVQEPIGTNNRDQHQVNLSNDAATGVLVASKNTNFNTSEQLILYQFNSTWKNMATPAPISSSVQDIKLAAAEDGGARENRSDRLVASEKGASKFYTLKAGESRDQQQVELEGDLSRLKAGNYQRTNLTPGSSTWAQLLKQATDGNVMESLMVTNRSMVSLLCETDDMLVRFKFKQPFHGSIVTNLDKFKSCRLLGTGALYYEMRISLGDCGTRQEAPRLFINNIQIQFHQSLDLADDEVKTIICTYPISKLKTMAKQPINVVSYAPEVKTGDGRSERIIEDKQIPSNPLAPPDSGLTTSAYLFTTTTTRKQKRATPFPVSTQIYRRSPSQTANRYLVPPLISMPDKKTSLLAKKYSSSKFKSLSLLRQVKQTKQQQQQTPQTQTKKLDQQTSTNNIISASQKPPIPPKPQQHQQKHLSNSLDSLSDNHSDSVTTIEIPISQAKSEKQQQSSNVQKIIRTEETTLKSIESSNSIVINEEKISIRRSFSSSSISSSRRRRMRAERTDSLEAEKCSKFQQKSKEVQVEPKTPPFGSLRATLTSPKEYKRLQDITRLFDEILIENHIDRGDKRTIVYKTTRLSPSKYKTKILDKMDEQERAKLKHLLTTDELFRSLVVESTSKEILRRKLRNSPTYSSLLRPESWDLLEEILLDKDINALE